jgi:HD-GYP domain-containing protein (c-di-GMP phosphodiesterase class II)
LSHPFPLSAFRITTQDQIATLRGLGQPRFRWVPEKSELQDEVDSAAVQRAAEQASARSAADAAVASAHERRQELSLQREAAQRCERQHGEAAQAWRAASDAVSVRPEDAGRTTEQLTRAILDKMLCNNEIGIRLVAGGGDRGAAHALNVGVISLLIGKTLGMTEQDLLDLGVGALMHDVGKGEVADRFRHAEEGFSAAELNAYRDHVAKGVVLGRRMALSPVLAQHHEHADGSGFPAKAAGERIGMAARVVALVNRYDNLCNPQSRTMALTPHEAVSVLFAQGRQRFDSAVLNAFIRMMGVYPAGSLVQLTDDRFAMVVGVNSSRPLKPRVLVHDLKVPRSEALVLDLERVTDLGIRRSLPANKLPAASVEYLDPRPRVSYYFEPLDQVVPEELAA